MDSSEVQKVTGSLPFGSESVFFVFWKCVNPARAK